MPKRKKQKEQEVDIISISMGEWYCYYRFGVFTPTQSKVEILKMFDEVREFKEYDESISIELKCEVIEDKPNLKLFKGNKIRMRIDLFYDLDKYPISAKSAIGFIDKNALGEYCIYTTVPKKSATYLLGMLSSGKIKEIQLLMTQLYYNQAKLISFEIFTNPEDI